MKTSLAERLKKKREKQKRKNELNRKNRAIRKANGGKSKWTAEERRKNVWLNQWKIKPGEVRNPEGINRHPLSEAYRQNLDSILPPELCKGLGLPAGSTIAEGIARRQVIDSITAAPKDAVKAAQEVGDRAEGKSVTRLSGPAGEGLFPPTLQVNFVRRKA